MSRRSRIALALGLGLAGGSTHAAGAQAFYRWSADVTVGGAIVSGGDFFNNGRATAHVSVIDRMVKRGDLAVYLEAGYDWFGVFGLLGADPDRTCIVTSSGMCEPPYPEVSGPSASIGLSFAPAKRVETRLGIGGAAYSVNGTAVGAEIGQLDATVVAAAHIGVVFGTRLAVIPRYRHDRLTLVPLLVGIRVQ